jgi:protein Tex
VDIGVHQDGLVHVSELSDRFVKDPNDVVRVGQRVSVRVLSVDAARKRIALSMKAPGHGAARGDRRPAEGSGKRPGRTPEAARKEKPAEVREGFAPNGMRIRRG